MILRGVMKRLFKILAFLVVLVVFVAVIAVFFIPEERIKAEVQKTVMEQTGRTLNYSDVGISVFPNLGLTLENVSLSNADWAGNEDMVEIDNVDVVLALAPLLQRQVEIKRFVLNAPLIRLQKNAQGEGNWLFESETATTAQTEATQSANADSGDDISVSFSDFVINDGTLIYNDAASGLQERVEDIDLTITMPDLQSNVDVKGDLIVRNTELKLEAHLESLKAITDETATPARLEASIAGTTIKFEGRYTPGANTLLDGAFDVSVKAVKDLIQLTSPEAEPQDYPVESFTASFNGQLGTDRAVYKDLKLNSDVLNVTGQGNFDLSGAKPLIGGSYQAEHINLDHFTGGDTSDAAANDDQAETEGQQNSNENWDTTPIDFSALQAVNADLNATVGGYEYDGMEFGGNTIQLKLNNSVLDLDVSETAAFEGTMSKSVRINTAGNTPSVKIIANMTGLQAKPFLTYFADYEKLTGTMNGNVNLNATGRSIADMTKTLGGTADVLFRDGNIEGVNIVDWTKSFQQRLSTVDESYGGTKFVEMGGQFNINQGIARNSDFRLIGPLVEASGSGSINIPNKTLNYRLVTKLLPAAQSEKSVTAGIDMPFNITGSWSDPKVRPDLQSVISDVLKDPEAAEQNLKNLKEVGKTLEDSFDGDKDQIKENVDQLKKILDGF
ncbi:MAG: AsmA family protein [Pseudomonadota bacterium]